MSFRHDGGDDPAATRRFWVIIGIACFIVGVLGYQAGRYLTSGVLSGLALQARPVKLPGEAANAVANTASERQVPESANVTIEERAPSEAEKYDLALRAAERQAALNEPQDGAQLNGGSTGDIPSADTSAEDETGKWMVVAGSFLQKSNADRVVADLAAKGYHPFVTEFDKNGVTYQRVNVASFQARSDADDLAKTLQEQGFTARVTSR